MTSENHNGPFRFRLIFDATRVDLRFLRQTVETIEASLDSLPEVASVNARAMPDQRETSRDVEATNDPFQPHVISIFATPRSDEEREACEDAVRYVADFHAQLIEEIHKGAYIRSSDLPISETEGFSREPIVSFVHLVQK